MNSGLAIKRLVIQTFDIEFFKHSFIIEKYSVDFNEKKKIKLLYIFLFKLS